MSLIEVKNIISGAICDISFTVDGKGIYCFLGSEGSGKTELAKILSGSSAPLCGEVLLDGVSIYESKKANTAAKLKIGYLSADSFFDSDMTVYEQLDFIGKMRRTDPDMRYRQIKEAMHLADIEGLRDRLIGEIGTANRKKTALAAALIGNPELLVLDEPLRGLGKDDKEMAAEIIKLAARRKTVLLFTARSAEAEKLSEKLGILAKGRLALFEDTEVVREKLKTVGEGGLSSVLEAFEETEESKAEGGEKQ